MAKTHPNTSIDRVAASEQKREQHETRWKQADRQSQQRHNLCCIHSIRNSAAHAAHRQRLLLCFGAIAELIEQNERDSSLQQLES